MLGGGGFRVPLVYEALTLDGGQTGIGEVVLYDVDPGRLSVISEVCRQMSQLSSSRAGPRLRTTADLADALRGSAFVFCAIRVGGLSGRVADEQVALQVGVLGQETVGAGGVSFGLRTVPVAVRLAERIAALAPEAWVVNFTNPAGMVTEAIAGVLGDRVVGVCDTPGALCRRVAGALGADPNAVWFDYVGLNHLGWLRGAFVDGCDRLPALLADDEALARLDEARLFGTDRLRTLRAVPNEYLSYYDLAVAQAVVYGRQTRGEYVADQQSRFYELAARRPERALEAWQAARRDRESTYMADVLTVTGGRPGPTGDHGGYEQVALAVMAALAGGDPARLILDVRNRGAVPGFDDAAVVEVPCLVDANGAHPFAVGSVDERMLRLMRAVKDAERATLHAARSRAREDAVRAFALHPLVGSDALARRLFDGYCARVPELAGHFGVAAG